MVLCTGAAHTGVAGPHLAAQSQMPVRRVRLQMMQTAPYPDRLTTSVADGDSLRYYPAYALPWRGLLPPQEQAAAAFRAQLLLVQRLDGSLTIGDTHEYSEPFAFDLDEAAYDHLRRRAELLLGSPLPPTLRRWAGVYSQVTTDDLYHRSLVASRRGAGHRPGRARHDLRTRDRRGDIHMTGITIACLDMAGTTVADDGSVIAAFCAAIGQSGLSPGTPAYDAALTVVHRTMGQSKITVFRRLLGSEDLARRANEAFERHYAASVRRWRGRCAARRHPDDHRPAGRRDQGLPDHRILREHPGRAARRAGLAPADRPCPVAR